VAELSPTDSLLGAQRPRRRRGLGVLLLVLLAGSAALWLFTRFLVGTDSPYFSAPVERGDLTPTLSLRGTLHGEGEVTIAAAQDGVVVSLASPGGMRVAAGQELVVLDTQALTRSMAANEAALDSAKEAQQRAQITLREHQVRLDRYEGVWRKSGGRVPSLNEMEGARGDVSRAEIDVGRARDAIEQSERRMAEDRAAMANAIARAPFAGYLVACSVAPGQWVHAGQPLCTIAANPDNLSLSVPITESDAGRLAAKAGARLLIDGKSDVERKGALVRIDRLAHGGREAVFALAPPEKQDAALLPGLDALAQIDLAERENVLLVPNAALTFSLHGEERSRQSGVYVSGSDGAPRFIAVALGANDGHRSEVLSSALQPGDQVIIGWRRDHKGS
jgi:HlyD family secretion protein